MNPIFLAQWLDIPNNVESIPAQLRGPLQDVVRLGSGGLGIGSGRIIGIEVASDAQMTYVCLLRDQRPLAELVLVDSPEASLANWRWFRARLQRLANPGQRETPKDHSGAMPPPLPWMGVVVWPGMKSLTASELKVVSAFEQYLGIVLLEGIRPLLPRSPLALINQFAAQLPR